ncbi:hypothetical protein Prudu_020172, partial [Prunus dulcis]
ILWSLNQAPRHQLTSKRDLQEVQRARTTSSRRAQGSTTGPFSNFRAFLLMCKYFGIEPVTRETLPKGN